MDASEKDISLSKVEKAYSIVFFLCGVLMKLYINTQQWGGMNKSFVNNPAFFPNIVAYGFIVMSIVLFISTLNSNHETSVKFNFTGIFVVLLWFGYVLLLDYLGFIIDSIIFLYLSLLIWGEKRKIVLFLVSLLSPIVIYLILGVLLNVSYPQGFLPF